jgi:hypothetical protein
MELWLFEGADADIMRCDVQDSGSYTIPPAALALFPVNNVTLSLWRVDSVIVTAGDTDVELEAATVYTSSGKVPVTP